MVKRILIIISIVLLFMALAFACSTKKKITKQSTTTETQTTTKDSTSQTSQANGISITDTRTIGRILDENRIEFDSIAVITISPQGTITAKGRNPVIHQSKKSESITQSNTLTDTTRTASLSEVRTQDQSQTIESTVTNKDLKRRPAFLSIVIVLALVGLLVFIIIGLKNSSFFR